MTAEEPRFHEGQNVLYLGTNKVGTVNKIIKVSRSFQYKITIDQKIQVVNERFLKAIADEDDSLIEAFISGKVGNHEDYKLFQTWLRLSRPIESNLYSYLGSKTIFNPFQFKPLLRFLSPNSEERLFIADEVGVGKTIESGIIIKEMMARNRLDYRSPILIVCPVSLGSKWVAEMKEKFSYSFHLHDGPSLKHMLKTTLREGIIPQGYTFSIVGLQLLRRAENIELLSNIDSRINDPLFSLVIIDEAHHLRNSETDCNELGNILSHMTEMMLMLSATPLNLRNEDLFNQMHILNESLFPDPNTFETMMGPIVALNRISQIVCENAPNRLEKIAPVIASLRIDPLGQTILTHPNVMDFLNRLDNPALFTTDEMTTYQRLFTSLSPLYYSFTRTRKREALDHQIIREVHELPITLTTAEQRFNETALRLIEHYYTSLENEDLPIGLIMNIYQRMASSCIPAFIVYLKWMVNAARAFKIDEKTFDQIEDDTEIETQEINTSLSQALSKLLEQEKDLEQIDSKYNQFKKMLQKIVSNSETSQAIVFSFFVRTLEYLKKRLTEDGFTVEVIHGNIPIQNESGQPGRDQTIRSFKEGKFQILLSSEVGGEGLDFQFCHAIINYDLPYNPMRVEQRIGRIDRFGQRADKIIITNLFIEGTVDEEIYERLYRRIRLIEDGVGSLETILGKELSDLQTAIITGSLDNQQKEEMQKRVEERVATAKAESEEFEKQSKQLLSDDYLSTPINSLSKGDFVSPADAQELTKICLQKWKGCKYSEDKEGLPSIQISQKIVEDLQHFLRAPGREGGYNELYKLISTKGSIKIIFDGQHAESHPDRLFLSPTGYWSTFLVEKLELEKSISKTFSFNVTNANLPIGGYVVFFFEIKSEGLKTDIELVAIPINPNENKVAHTDFVALPRNLSRAMASQTKPPNYVNSQELLDSAMAFLDELLEEKRKKQSEENSFRAESRITALKRGTEIRIERLQQQIQSHIQNRRTEGREPDDSYIKLKNAMIEKEKARLSFAEEDIHKKQVLTLDYNLQAIAYIDVIS
jgi:superfamily II DNA or RNA helicase